MHSIVEILCRWKRKEFHNLIAVSDIYEDIFLGLSVLLTIRILNDFPEFED